MCFRYPVIRNSLRRVISLCLTLPLLCCGCDTNQYADSSPTSITPLPALAALGAQPGAAIIAQGQLAPANGLVAISGPPGDRIASISVREGQQVEKEQILATLESISIKRTELAVAEIQLKEARIAADGQRKVADANLAVAKMGLQQAELRFRQAKDLQAREEEHGGRLDLLTRRVELAEAKLKQLQDAAKDPKAGKLVSTSVLDEQALDVEDAAVKLQAARHTAREGIQLGALAVEEASKNIAAAQQAIDSGVASQSFESLQRKIDLLKLQVLAAELRSPISGVVLSIAAKAGEATTGMPAMHVADVGTMICKVEVNVVDLERIHVGAFASLVSSGMKPMAGRVLSVSSMVGSPRLPQANPLQRVDWRSVEVIVQIDQTDTVRASKLVNLQVDVAIKADVAVTTATASPVL